MKHKKTDTKYRLRNWKDYNESLVQRGSLTVWLSEEVAAVWRAQGRTGKRGHPQSYTETAILMMATLQEVYHLPLRQTEGFLRSLFELLKLDLAVPDYSTLSRRRAALEIELPYRRRNEPVHLVVDSTGIKVFGEGEWKVRQYGYTYRRSWRKLHLGVDESSGEILATVITTNDYTDGQILPELLDQVSGQLDQVSGDGAYDKRDCYGAIQQREAKAVIPPQRNARVWQHGNAKQERLPRDQNLRRIRKVGRAAWKRESNYHRRSLAETTMFRLKLIFGGRASARSFNGQAAQLLVRCAALNRITQLGMPDSYKADAT